MAGNLDIFSCKLVVKSRTGKLKKLVKSRTFLFYWHFEAKNDDKTEVQDEEAIELIKEEDEDREVLKPKKKRKPPQIQDSDDEMPQKTIVK